MVSRYAPKWAKVVFAISAWHGEGALRSPAPERRSADSHDPAVGLHGCGLHATFYALNFVPVDSCPENGGLSAISPPLGRAGVVVLVHPACDADSQPSPLSRSVVAAPASSPLTWYL